MVFTGDARSIFPAASLRERVVDLSVKKTQKKPREICARRKGRVASSRARREVADVTRVDYVCEIARSRRENVKS